MKNKCHCEAKYQIVPKQSKNPQIATAGCAGLAMTMLLTACSKSAFACAVCFGDPNSQMSKGVIAGIFVLVGVVGSVLGGIIAIGISWIAKARQLEKN